MPRFWIWYTGCVGLCLSFSPLGGTGAAGGGGAVPPGLRRSLWPPLRPFPLLPLHEHNGLLQRLEQVGRQGLLEAGAALTAGVRRCWSAGEILALTAPSLPFHRKESALLTRSAGGFERMMGFSA